MKIKGKVLALLAAMTFSYGMMDYDVALAENVQVNENIFKWVQSSSRMGYFFNKQQICYKLNDGEIDLDTLIVPILKVYDPIQIQDTLDKRRWHMQSLSGFGDLVGRSEFAEIHISSRTVDINEAYYLDSTWTVIEAFNPDMTLQLDDMSDRSLDKRFFEAILDYAQRHQLELAVRTSSKIDQELLDQIAVKQEEYILLTDDPEGYQRYLEEKAAKEESNNKNKKDKNKNDKKDNKKK